MNETHKYDSIIDLPHHQAADRPHLSMHDRAAQFAPFAALTGHEDAIRETQRLTDEWTALTEEEQLHLSRQALSLMERCAAGERPSVGITVFRPDARKEGGSYETVSGQLRRVDETAGIFHMTDGTCLEMRYIAEIWEE